MAVDREKLKKKKAERAKLAKTKAAIGFTYGDSTEQSGEQQRWDSNITTGRLDTSRKSDSDSDTEKQDLDLTIDTSTMSRDEKAHCNQVATAFGLGPNDFVRFSRDEKHEADEIAKMKEEEDEKAQFSVSLWQSVRFHR